VFNTATWVLVPNRHHAILFRKWQRINQERLDGAEDRTVRADAERQRNYRNRRETRPLDDAPDCVTKIVEKGFHRSSNWLIHSAEQSKD
jgi:hypothetical protein